MTSKTTETAIAYSTPGRGLTANQVYKLAFYFAEHENATGAYRAKIADVIMTDGYRYGRWECSRVHFERFRDVILARITN